MKATVIPMIVGALGTILKNQEETGETGNPRKN